MPSFEVLVTIVVQSAPLFTEYSSFTLAMAPCEVQVIAWLLPAYQLSPPLGVVNVKAGGGGGPVSASITSSGLFEPSFELE